MKVQITVDYDEEYNEATVSIRQGLYGNVENFPLESISEVWEAIKDFKQELVQYLKEAGMKEN